MGTRVTARDRGRARAEVIQRRLAEEVRDARLSLGLSQADAARLAGLDRSSWGRFERLEQDLPLGALVLMTSVVGLDLSLKTYPSDLRHPRDVAHLRLLADTRLLLGPDWDWRYEIVFGPAPSRRAWDGGARHRRTGVEFRTEAETSLRDIQQVQRLVAAKKADSGDPRVLLVVRASRNNRLVVRAAADTLRTAFPVPGRVALARLRAGADPGGDALLLVDWMGVNAPGR
jgi:transcriptional regulator with XRE-family HTH domain